VATAESVNLFFAEKLERNCGNRRGGIPSNSSQRSRESLKEDGIGKGGPSSLRGDWQIPHPRKTRDLFLEGSRVPPLDLMGCAKTPPGNLVLLILQKEKLCRGRKVASRSHERKFVGARYYALSKAAKPGGERPCKKGRLAIPMKGCQ